MQSACPWQERIKRPHAKLTSPLYIEEQMQGSKIDPGCILRWTQQNSPHLPGSFQSKILEINMKGDL